MLGICEIGSPTELFPFMFFSPRWFFSTSSDVLYPQPEMMFEIAFLRNALSLLSQDPGDEGAMKQ